MACFCRFHAQIGEVGLGYRRIHTPPGTEITVKHMLEDRLGFHLEDFGRVDLGKTLIKNSLNRYSHLGN